MVSEGGKLGEESIVHEMNMNFTEARETMVRTQIESRGIVDPRVLKAMRTVPREVFVPEDMVSRAYEDTPLPIGFNQSISQPFIVAHMLQLAELSGNERVLDIGGGSGYQAALLGEIGSEVYSLEIINELAVAARQRMKRLGYKNVKVIRRDASNGYKRRAPFDRIIAAARVDTIPQEWIDQLNEGGIIIYPEGPQYFTRLIRLIKKNGIPRKEIYYNVAFVPLISE